MYTWLRRWHFGFNDPTLAGWTITAAYLIAFLLCLRAGARSKRTAGNGAPDASGIESGGDRSNAHGLWFLFAAILLLLGLNKQLDLQSLIGYVVRKVTNARGWGQYRRAAQAVFIVVFALTGVFAVVLILKKFMKRRLEYGIAPVGMVMLIAVIVLRAGFILRVDDIFLGRDIHIPHRVYSLFELFSICLAGLGAFITMVRERIRNLKEFRLDFDRRNN